MHLVVPEPFREPFLDHRLKRYSSVTRVIRVHTVPSTKLVIGIFIYVSVPVSKQRVLSETSYKLSLTLSLMLFLSTKVQLDDI